MVGLGRTGVGGVPLGVEMAPEVAGGGSMARGAELEVCGSVGTAGVIGIKGAD